MLLISKNIKNGITVLTENSSEIIWLKLSKEYFGLKMIYSCALYT